MVEGVCGIRFRVEGVGFTVQNVVEVQEVLGVKITAVLHWASDAPKP